jgi:hypothetical protein
MASSSGVGFVYTMEEFDLVIRDKWAVTTTANPEVNASIPPIIRNVDSHSVWYIRAKSNAPSAETIKSGFIL